MNDETMAGEEFTEDDLQEYAQTFLEELTALCKEWGFELDMCLECPALTLTVSDGLLDKYVLNGNHIDVRRIEMANTI